jgi:hypothetical protein
MMKKIGTLSIFVLAFVVASSCGSKVVPISEKLKKVWLAKTVNHGSSVVFQSSNVSGSSDKGYSNYKLNLSSGTSVVLNDRDGGTYSGTYVSTDTKLTLSSLSPQPTGTGGTLDYTIVSITDTEMTIKSTTAYPKTGNTINTYFLVAQ